MNTPGSSVVGPCLEMADEFLGVLIGKPNPPTTFQTFPDKKPGRPELARVLHGPLSTHRGQLDLLNRWGACISNVVNETDGVGRSKANVLAPRSLFVDCDDGPLKCQLQLEPSAIVHSARGDHIYWFLKPGEPLDRFSDVQAALAQKLGTDPNVCDPGRAMRLPGSLHQREAPKLVTVEVSPSRPRYSYAEVMGSFGINAEQWQGGGKPKNTQAPDDGPIIEGGRNSRLFSLAGAMRRQGASEQAIADALGVENEKRCVPPLETEEVEAIAASAMRYEAQPAPTQPTPILDAQGALQRLLDAVGKESTAVFAVEHLAVAASLQRHHPQQWAHLKAALKAKRISVRDFERALTPEVRDQLGSKLVPGRRFLVNDGHLFVEKPTRHGNVTEYLANFTAQIVADQDYSDGAVPRREFVIAGQTNDGRQLPQITVPADEFSVMGWVLERWGACARISAGRDRHDLVRESIQQASPNPARTRVVGHLGWGIIDNNPVFAHYGGTISAVGQMPGVRVSVAGGHLARCVLPNPTSGPALKQAIDAVLGLHAVAQGILMGPLLAAPFRACLNEFVPAAPSIVIEGRTGNYKSSVAAIVQNFFGHGFDTDNPLANWSSTANALELITFAAKDIVVVVDDFNPTTGSPHDIDRYHREADRLLRGAANQGGRQRMTADGSLRQTFFPRCLVIVTAEELPKGHSLGARFMALPVQPGQVDVGNLTQAQEQARQGIFATATASYIQWLVPQYALLKQWLPRRLIELRDACRQFPFVHNRGPEIPAHLMLGFETFTRFAVEQGCLTPEEKYNWDARVWQALVSAMQVQTSFHQEIDPARRFVQLLGTAIFSGRAHVRPAKGEDPKRDRAWGFRGGLWLGRAIGWLDNDTDLYLEPDGAFAAAREAAEGAGERFPYTPQTLGRRLKDAGLLVSFEAERGRLTVRKTFGGARSENGWWHLRADSVVVVEQEPAQTTAFPNPFQSTPAPGVPHA